MRTIPDVPTTPVGRTSRWDTSISPQERKSRHEAAERERKQRNARRSAERAKLAQKSAGARANRTAARRLIIDEELRRLEAMANDGAAASWRAAFSTPSDRFFKRSLR